MMIQIDNTHDLLHRRTDVSGRATYCLRIFAVWQFRQVAAQAEP